MSGLEFHLFLYGAYPDIPHSYTRPNSVFIDLPNRYYEPIRGQWYLEQYLDALAFGEKVGYDGLITSTQFGGPVGMTPSANMTVAYLAARTERIKLGAVGPILNSYASPMRVAEEIAFLDNISGGRVILGLPMGHGMNYHAAATMNPSLARQRYWEAHDLIIRAFTSEGPFEWQGEHFHIPYANLWPRPVQQPHPEIWIPAAGSKITLEKAAENHYTYQALFSPRKVLVRNIQTFRDAANKHGYEPDPKQIAAVSFIHVAESDKQAKLEAEAHLMFLFQNLNRSPNHDAFPPGHFSVDSLRGFMKGGGYRDRDLGAMSYEELLAEDWAIVGSPATVCEKLEGLVAELGAGRVVHAADFGAMPNWMMRKSLTLMAEEVIPHFRDPDGKPVWAKQDPRPAPTVSEMAAKAAPVQARPQARTEDGRVIDVRTAHVADLNESHDCG